MSTQSQMTPALAFELFTELKSRSDASRWQKAVEGVSDLSLKVYGQLPTFQVIDGSAAYKATIFDSKRWSCVCPDFTNRLQKKGTACRHLGAVALLSFLPLAAQEARERGASPLADELEALRQNISQTQARIEEEAERQAIQQESASADPASSPDSQPPSTQPERETPSEKQTEPEVKTDNSQPSTSSSNRTPHMTLKRSLSPDGRIDSLSIEIDVPITKSSTAELQEQALKLIALQDAIWQKYIHRLRETEKQSNGQNEQNRPPAKGSQVTGPPSTADSNNETPQKARLVEVGQTDTQYGQRVVVSFELAGGRKAKLFGSEKAIAKQLVILGLKLESIKLGKRLNVPCLVTMRINGKFLNVERVFPSVTQ